MAANRQYLVLSITILLCIVFSSCSAYQLFRDPTAPIRPIKYHIWNEPDRYVDRMKQYHDTVARLKLWRRYIDEVEDNDDLKLQEILHQYKSPDNGEHS